MRTRIKICGITTTDDARAAIAAGADALGLNFFAKSTRYLTTAQAAALLRVLPPYVEPIGLFVNETWDHIEATARSLGLRAVQVHGDRIEPCKAPWLRWTPAFAVRDEASLEMIRAFVRSCDVDSRPAAVLVDAHVAGHYGGTGQTAPWALLAGFDPGVPLVLAGGLTPDNVADAVRQVRPYAVDVASGVESSPGRKDAEKMARFVVAVRNA